MTQDEIIRFAIQCRLVTTDNRDGLYMDALTEFANLVAAKALAQPEQEPVAWMCSDFNLMHRGYSRFSPTRQGEWSIPLYTASPQRTWVGLTDEEVDECYYWKDRQWTTDELVRHVEAKLKEKNT